ncbi:MAG: hypothetical protein OTJ44_09045 [Planctomycetota bacterium]|nr:hypothetical protein [Planctomycetota bacterium]
MENSLLRIFPVALLAAAASLVSCSSEPAPKSAQSIDQQVQIASDQFLEYWNAGDADSLSKLFAEDSVRVISTAQLPSTGRTAIKAAFMSGMKEFRTSDAIKLVSQTKNVQELEGNIVLADGTFTIDEEGDIQLSGMAGYKKLHGKWATVYRKTDSGLEILMESAHVAKDALPTPIDYSSIEREQVPAAQDYGNAAEYADATQNLTDTYSAGMKNNNGAMIASIFTEDGIQLVSSSSEANRGRAAIEQAMTVNLPEEGYAGTTLVATTLRQRKVSDSLVIGNGLWQVVQEDGTVLEFGQWGNLMQVQEDGSLMLLMESAGGFTVMPK